MLSEVSLWLWPGPIRSSQPLVYAHVCIHVYLNGLGKNSDGKPILKNLLRHARVGRSYKREATESRFCRGERGKAGQEVGPGRVG